MTGTPGPYKSDDGDVYLDNLPLLTPILRRGVAKRRHGPSAEAVSDMIAEGLNRGEHFDSLVEALEKIAKGEGRFDTDKHQHACNTIQDMKGLAKDALAKARGEEG